MDADSDFELLLDAALGIDAAHSCQQLQPHAQHQQVPPAHAWHTSVHASSPPGSPCLSCDSQVHWELEDEHQHSRGCYSPVHGCCSLPTSPVPQSPTQVQAPSAVSTGEQQMTCSQFGLEITADIQTIAADTARLPAPTQFSHCHQPFLKHHTPSEPLVCGERQPDRPSLTSSTLSCLNLTILPREVIMRVLCCLSADALSTMAQTCQQLHQMCDEPVLWRRLFCFRWGKKGRQQTNLSWKVRKHILEGQSRRRAQFH